MQWSPWGERKREITIFDDKNSKPISIAETSNCARLPDVLKNEHTSIQKRENNEKKKKSNHQNFFSRKLGDAGRVAAQADGLFKIDFFFGQNDFIVSKKGKKLTPCQECAC